MLRTHPNFAGALGEPVSETLVSVYFDSDELFLRDHGLTLRVRHIGDKRIQTIKSADHGIFERSEWEQTYRERSTEPCPCRGHSARADSHRRHSQCLEAGVRDPDRTDVLSPERRRHRHRYRIRQGTDRREPMRPARFPKSNLSSSAASRPNCSTSRERSAILVPAQLDVKSKSERGFDLVEKASIAAEKAYEPELSAGTSAGRAFTLIARACLRQLLANESATKKRNAEALHQMRIALRRLRAAISLFSAVVTDPRVEAIKTELKWLGRELAPARDLDSFLIEALRPLRKQQAERAGAHQHQQDVRAGAAQELSAGAGGGRSRLAFAPSFSTPPNGSRPDPGAPRTIR